MSRTAELLKQALKQHQDGAFSIAERTYRQILRSESRHADALHLLGVLAHQTGRSDLAIDQIKQAVTLQPHNAVYLCNLGAAYQATAQYAAAVSCYRRALAEQPRYADAHFNLGVALEALQDPDAAIESYSQATKFKPDHAEAFNNIGNLLRQKGSLDEASRAYQQALQARPNYALAHFNLAQTEAERGHAAAAMDCYRRAIHAQPDYPEALFQLAKLAEQESKHSESIHALQQLLALRPEDSDALNALGLVRLAMHEPEEALGCFDRAAEHAPDSPVIHGNRGNAWLECGNPTAAAAAYRKALELAPESAELHNNLGLAMQQLAQFEAARDAHLAALQLKPDFYQARNNLGVVLRNLGDLSAARDAFATAVEQQPDYAESLYNLACAHRDLGDSTTAEADFQQVIQTHPEWVVPRHDYARLLRDSGRYEESIGCFEELLRRDPERADAWCGLGIAQQSAGRFHEAEASYRRCLKLNADHAHARNNLASILAHLSQLVDAANELNDLQQRHPEYPGVYANLATLRALTGEMDSAETAFQQAFQHGADDVLRLIHAVTLPPIYQSRVHLEECRTEFSNRLEKLEQRNVAYDPQRQLLANNFYLAYQGQNDRDLQSRFARLCCGKNVKSLPMHGEIKPHRRSVDGRIRVAFCSRYFREHTIGRLFQGLIQNLDRQRFHVSVVCIDPQSDAIATAIKGLADEYIPLQLMDVAPAYQRLRDEQFDVLFYTDLGMDRLSWTLACNRLASVQCTTWGHPVTTGLPGIDYFISSRLIEPDNSDYGAAENHYTEQLIQFESLPMCYTRPEIPAAMDIRERMGLSSSQHAYLCPQSLFKLHPDFDFVLAQILRRDPNGVVLLLNGLHAPWTELIKQRLHATIPDVAGRVRFLPAAPHAEFLQRLAASDVVLDPIHFGGGNSTFESLAAGTPIVTWPGPLMRGRGAFAAYRKLGLEAAVAKSIDEYVSLAVRFACESDFREEFCHTLRERSNVLFDDRTAVSELESFFEAAVAAAESGSRITTGDLPKVKSQSDNPNNNPIASRADNPAVKQNDNQPFDDRSGVTAGLPKTVVADALRTAAAIIIHRENPMPSMPHIQSTSLAAAAQEAAIRQASGTPAAPQPPAANQRSTIAKLPPATSSKAPTAAAPVSAPPTSVAGPAPSVPQPAVSSTAPAGAPAASTVLPMPNRVRLSSVLRDGTCPACGHHVQVPFYNGGNQPLTTLAWPKSAEEARSMPRLPHNFLRCVDCGHVHNHDFDYANVPYSEKPNLMFNAGTVWQTHLERVRDLLLDRLPPRPVVAEVGCGTGHLLQALAQKRSGRYVGFDPSGAIDTAGGLIEARAELFDPAVHIGELRPHVIISRHVMEHLMNPLGFVQSLAFAASWENVESRLFIEVPCIDHTLRSGRTVDFFYEHNSHFTSTSLERMLLRCANHVELVERGYNDEVVYGFAVFRRRADQMLIAGDALRFHDDAVRSRLAIRRDIDALAESGVRVAVWGGTGKAAAFINQYGLDAARFPLVVDSDTAKVGTYVPGMGQKILFRDELLTTAVDVVLIATQWRARDIVLEMQRTGIRVSRIMLEHNGRLVDYSNSDHPYRLEAAA